MASDKSSCDKLTDCNHLPDACTNDVREEKLIQRQSKDDGRNCLHRILARDRNLIIAGVILIVALNFSEGRYLLYPFMIFSTWIHEMCHGTAALLVGGRFSKLQIFEDGSGLAFTSTSGGAWQRGFVASAGYPGTAVMGCLLLLFRRTTLGPTIGTMGLGFLVALSCLIWVRNTFGLWALLLEGFFLMLLGWKLPAHFLDHLYNFLSLTCSLNAVDSIHDLFASNPFYIGGLFETQTDAHVVAKEWGGFYLLWASFWFFLAIFLTVIGILFAFDARQVNTTALTSSKTGWGTQSTSAATTTGGGGGGGGGGSSSASVWRPSETRPGGVNSTMANQHSYQLPVAVATPYYE